jgi:hypothetical protein
VQDKVTLTMDVETAKAVVWTLSMRAAVLRMQLANETSVSSSHTAARRQMAARLDDGVKALDRALNTVTAPSSSAVPK